MEEPEELGLCGLYLFILTRLEKCLKYLLINSFTIVRIGSFRVNLNIIMKITLSSKTSQKNKKQQEERQPFTFLHLFSV